MMDGPSANHDMRKGRHPHSHSHFQGLFLSVSDPIPSSLFWGFVFRVCFTALHSPFLPLLMSSSLPTTFHRCLYLKTFDLHAILASILFLSFPIQHFQKALVHIVSIFVMSPSLCQLPSSLFFYPSSHKIIFFQR
jgi:hypothetical protein